jgi:hypothetical protein
MAGNIQLHSTVRRAEKTYTRVMQATTDLHSCGRVIAETEVSGRSVVEKSYANGARHGQKASSGGGLFSEIDTETAT